MPISPFPRRKGRLPQLDGFGDVALLRFENTEIRGGLDGRGILRERFFVKHASLVEIAALLREIRKGGEVKNGVQDRDEATKRSEGALHDDARKAAARPLQ
jgi:hypothetical protein